MIAKPETLKLKIDQGLGLNVQVLKAAQNITSKTLCYYAQCLNEDDDSKIEDIASNPLDTNVAKKMDEAKPTKFYVELSGFKLNPRMLTNDDVQELRQLVKEKKMTLKRMF